MDSVISFPWWLQKILQVIFKEIILMTIAILPRLKLHKRHFPSAVLFLFSGRKKCNDRNETSWWISYIFHAFFLSHFSLILTYISNFPRYRKKIRCSNRRVLNVILKKCIFINTSNSLSTIHLFTQVFTDIFFYFFFFCY